LVVGRTGHLVGRVLLLGDAVRLVVRVDVAATVAAPILPARTSAAAASIALITALDFGASASAMTA
jgi:hypothetical protein